MNGLDDRTMPNGSWSGPRNYRHHPLPPRPHRGRAASQADQPPEPGELETGAPARGRGLRRICAETISPYPPGVPRYCPARSSPTRWNTSAPGWPPVCISRHCGQAPRNHPRRQFTLVKSYALRGRLSVPAWRASISTASPPNRRRSLGAGRSPAPRIDLVDCSLVVFRHRPVARSPDWETFGWVCRHGTRDKRTAHTSGRRLP
jgi:hypothetical protein